jgi:O-antigen/teichoic acid export membrane protein
LRNRLGTIARTPGGAGSLQILGVAILNVLLASILARRLDGDSYANWIILAQVSTAINILEIGSTQVLTRRVQVSMVRSGSLGAESEFNAGRALARLILRWAGLSLIVVELVVAFRFGSARALDTIPFALHGLAYVSASPYHGLLRGLNRLHTSVGVSIGGRALGYSAVVLLSILGSRLVLLGLGLLLGSTASQLVLVRLAREWGGSTADGLTSVHFREGLPLSLAGASVLLITGADVLVVGAFAGSSLPTYANGAALVALATGYQWAAFAGLPRRMAELSALGDREGISREVVRLTRQGVGIVTCAAGLLGFVAPVCLSAWLGNVDPKGLVAVRCLLLATVVRNLFTVWSLTLLGTGDYLRVRWVPYVEAVVNLSTSILLAARFGAVGAALGTLAGGVVSGSIYLFWGLSNTREFVVSRSKFAFKGVVGGISPGIPYLMLLASTPAGWLGRGWLALVAISVATAISAVVVWKTALDDSARSLVRDVGRSINRALAFNGR